MSKYFYKHEAKNPRKLLRWFGLLLSLTGIGMVMYIFLLILIWQLYVAPAFAQQDLVTPIPKAIMLSSFNLKNMVLDRVNSLVGQDYYSNAQNWFPAYVAKKGQPRVSFYTLSIPSINIQNALVSTVDNDLSSHLVNFEGTAIPPEKGTVDIFGHSTLHQLFNPTNYHTIFAYVDKLKVGDKILATVDKVTYTYRIFAMTVVSPDDTSIFSQNYADSYLTLVTCTPPGTTFARLIVQARLEKL